MIERRPSSQRSLAPRAKVILECAQGKSNLEVAKQLDVCQHMVGKWRRRFIEDSLEGLVDAPRSGAPREISDEKVEEVVTKTLETTPPARTHWSSWLMAKEAGMPLNHSYKDEPDTPILRAGFSVMLFTRQKSLSRSRI